MQANQCYLDKKQADTLCEECRKPICPQHEIAINLDNPKKLKKIICPECKKIHDLSTDNQYWIYLFALAVVAVFIYSLIQF